MGRKVNPIAYRTQLNAKWQSRWYAKKADYADFLLEDVKLREYILANYGNRAGISEVTLERKGNDISIFIKTSRPGVLIGRGGSGATEMKAKLQKLVKNKIKDINIEEVKNADLDPRILGETIVSQLERRIAFRRAMRQALDKATKAGAKGVKISISGRLNGAEIARRETLNFGTIPLQTIRADVRYANLRAKTTFGIIGIKVWIFTGGEVKNEVEVNAPVDSIIKGQ